MRARVREPWDGSALCTEHPACEGLCGRDSGRDRHAHVSLGVGGSCDLRPLVLGGSLEEEEFKSQRRRRERECDRYRD